MFLALLHFAMLIVYHKCPSDTCVTNKYPVSPNGNPAAPVGALLAQPGGSSAGVLDRGFRTLSMGPAQRPPQSALPMDAPSSHYCFSLEFVVF